MKKRRINQNVYSCRMEHKISIPVHLYFHMWQWHSLNSSMRRFYEWQELIRRIHRKRHTRSLNKHTTPATRHSKYSLTQTYTSIAWGRAHMKRKEVIQIVPLGFALILFSYLLLTTCVNCFHDLSVWKHLFVFSPLHSCVCPELNRSQYSGKLCLRGRRFFCPALFATQGCSMQTSTFTLIASSELHTCDGNGNSFETNP